MSYSQSFFWVNYISENHNDKKLSNSALPGSSSSLWHGQLFILSILISHSSHFDASEFRTSLAGLTGSKWVTLSDGLEMISKR